MPVAAKLQLCVFLKDNEPWYHAFLEAGASPAIVFPRWTLGTRAMRKSTACHPVIYCANVVHHEQGDTIMTSLHRLESQVAALPEQELRRFRSWFDEFDARRGDNALSADINNGKLDSFAEEALAQYGSSLCKPL